MNIALIKLLIKIKNASFLNARILELDYNKFGFLVVKSLYKAGLIQSYLLLNKKIIIFLRSLFNLSFLRRLRIVSTPSLKNRLNYKVLCKIENGYTLFFFSTNKGILTLHQCKQYKTGGTLLFLC